MEGSLLARPRPAKAAKNFLTENVTALKSFAEYVAPGELTSLDDLKPGEGGIVRRGLAKIAAYRDEAGALHLNSASCTHVGCHLHWNSFETCWDCPCHGSMFDVKGSRSTLQPSGLLRRWKNNVGRAEKLKNLADIVSPERLPKTEGLKRKSGINCRYPVAPRFRQSKMIAEIFQGISRQSRTLRRLSSNEPHICLTEHPLD